MSDKTYQCNEIFYSLQGEGVRAGTANVFIRFTRCNLKCSGEEVAPGITQPICDTEFTSGRKVTLEEMAEWTGKQVGIALGCTETPRIVRYGLQESSFWEEPWIICTGGEPALQVDQAFCDFWHARGVRLAIETNGTIELPYAIVGDGVCDGELINERKQYLFDWITVSPKVAEHCIKQRWASELKYVRSYGQGIPKPTCQAEHYLISPMAEGNLIHPDVMKWCQKLVLENPMWRLSVQQHKAWQMR